MNNNLRNEWSNIKLYKELYGSKVTENDWYVKTLKYKLSLLPQNVEVFIIAAYGSLMKDSDISRTMKPLDTCPGYIKGYQRILNLGKRHSGSYMNIAPIADVDTAAGYYMPVNLIKVKYTEMPAYLAREALYSPQVVDVYDMNKEKMEEVGVTVVGDSHNYGVEPQLNYVHLCLHGINDLHGFDGIDDFVKNTLCYNSNKADLTSVDEWMKDLNLKDYMIRLRYSSR